MNFDYVKKNKAAVLVAALAIMIAGAVIFAQNDTNPNNDIASIFSKKVTIPPGTVINAILDSTISSAGNNVGDTVIASVNSPLIIEGNTSIPAGSKLIGKITSIERAVNADNALPGSISLNFDKIETPNGYQLNISGGVGPQRGTVSNKVIAITTQRSGKQKFVRGVRDTAIGAGAGAVLGTAIGAIAGGKMGVGRGAWSGTAIGGGLGATEGVIAAVRDKGTTTYVNKPVAQDVVLQSGSNIFVTLNQPVQVIAHNLK